MTETLVLPEILRIPPKLLPVITDFNDYNICLLEGGRGSSKTQSIARLLLYLGEHRRLRIVCGREVAANIEESVYTALVDLIREHKLAYVIEKYKIYHVLSGTVFTFRGFREQGAVNVKGLEGVDILWVDEAQAITKWTLDIIMPTIRKAKAKVFFTMNRFLRDDAVPEYCEARAASRGDVLAIHIDYFDNPFCPLELKKQAEDMKARSERDYRHVWLGQPLSQADDYLFNLDKLHDAFQVKPFGGLDFRQRVLSIDFAAQGNDQCVASVLDRASSQHWGLTDRLPWDEPDTMISVGRIVKMVGELKPSVTILDIGGMGKPVYDRLTEIGLTIVPFDGGSTTGIDTRVYGNRRSAAYHLIKDWFDQGFLRIEERDREVVRQLEKIKVVYRSSGVRFIQPKTEMKKELRYSPDDADSLMMAVWAAVHHMSGSATTIAGAPAGSVVRRTGQSRRFRRSAA